MNIVCLDMKKILFLLLIAVCATFSLSAQSSNIASPAVQPTFDISVVGIDNYPPIILIADTIKANGVLELTMDEGYQETMLQIFDDNGKLLHFQMLVNAKSQISFADYERGLYYVSLIKGKKALKIFQVAKM